MEGESEGMHTLLTSTAIGGLQCRQEPTPALSESLGASREGTLQPQGSPWERSQKKVDHLVPREEGPPLPYRVVSREPEMVSVNSQVVEYENQ